MKIKEVGSIPNNKDLELYLQQRVIPIRFCYLKEGGDIWHKLRQDNQYSLGERELTAFKRSLSDVVRIIGKQPINLVHLGPGDGIEIPSLFETFRPNGNGRYAGVDISKQMIHNTFELNKSYFLKTNPLWYLIDIESEGSLELVCEDVKNNGANRNLLIASNGGTLLSNNLVFRYLRNSMSNEDYLFINLEGDDSNKRDEICSTYELQETQKLLAVGLKRAGYSAEDGSFRTYFDETYSRIEVYFKPENKKEILCLTSYKPKEKDFRKKLNEAGLCVDYLKFYKDVHTFTVVCTKKGE